MVEAEEEQERDMNRRDEKAKEASEAVRALLKKLRDRERRGESGRLTLRDRAS